MYFKLRTLESAGKTKSMRNRLMHRYDDVSMVVAWNSVERDIPRLIQDVESLAPPECPLFRGKRSSGDTLAERQGGHVNSLASLTRRSQAGGGG